MSKTIDFGPTGKYFHIVLNMADDDLDPFEYRLLGHYKRVCGISGSCYESIETTAKICKMSVAKARQTRRALKRLGYVSFNDNTNGRPVDVDLIDRMEENIKRYLTPIKNVTPIESDRASTSIVFDSALKPTPIESDSPMQGQPLSNPIDKEEPNTKNKKEPIATSPVGSSQTSEIPFVPDTALYQKVEESIAEHQTAATRLSDATPEDLPQEAKSPEPLTTGKVLATALPKKKSSPRKPQATDGLFDATTLGLSGRTEINKATRTAYSWRVGQILHGDHNDRCSGLLAYERARQGIDVLNYLTLESDMRLFWVNYRKYHPGQELKDCAKFMEAWDAFRLAQDKRVIADKPKCERCNGQRSIVDYSDNPMGVARPCPVCGGTREQ